MGCGESKHDVASGNTVRNSKRLGSKKGYETLPSEKPVADPNAVTVNDDSKTNSAVEDNKVNQKAKEDEKLKPAVKETDENEKLKVSEEAAKVEEKFKEVKEEKKEDDKSIPSVKENDKNENMKVAEEIPKVDDKLKVEVSEKEKEKETTIAEIITEEGISDKSEYNTPVAKAVETPKLKDVVVEENKTETQKEEAGELKEEIPVKEEKVSATIAEEGKVSTVVAEEEKASTAIAEEGKVSPSNEEINGATATAIATKEETVPATDSKTN